MHLNKIAESGDTVSCSSNQRKKTQGVIDAIFEESSSSNEGDKESDFYGDEQDVHRTFVSDSELCFRESILHRDLELQSKNKCDSDDSDHDSNDASDNYYPLDDSDSQSLASWMQVRVPISTKRGVHCLDTKQRVLKIFWILLVWEIFE